LDSTTNHRVYEFGTFRLDSAGQLLICTDNEQVVQLTPRVFDTLLFLVEHAGELVSRQNLIEAVWPDVVVENNNLEQCISALRQALRDQGGENQYIVTVRGRGYRFSSPVRLVDAQPRRRQYRLAYIALALTLVAAIVTLVYWWSPIGPQQATVTSAPKLAVLPFQPMSPADHNASLEFGMTEALIQGLNTADLSVASLSAVRRFGGAPDNAIFAGRALGVAAVLEGYLQRDGNRLSVSARLLDVASGRQLWADRYEEEITGIFNVQDTIANRVREALMPQLVGEVRVLQHYTDDAAAYELYVSGRLHRQRGDLPSLMQALDYFEQAANQDPDFALAYVGIADIRSILGVFGIVSPNETFPLARIAVQRALHLAPDLAEAHASLGHIKTQFEHDWRGAELELRRAIELNPYYALAHQWLGLLLSESGQFDAGLEHLRKAYELEPVPAFGALIGMALAYRGDVDAAIGQLQNILAIDASLPTARSYLVLALLRAGQLEDAAAQLDLLPGMAPGSVGLRGRLYAQAGDHTAALAEAERLIAMSAQRYVSAYDIATIFGALNDADQAFLWLGRAFEERAQLIGWLPWDAAFDSIRDDARYADLMRGLNLSPLP